MKKIIIITGILILFSILSASKLEFYKENLNFTVEKDKLTVNGLYFFRNKSDRDIKTILAYPYPQNEELFGKIDSVYAQNIDTDEDVLLKTKPKASYVNIFCKANSTTCVRIAYSHILKRDIAHYILLTTKYWRKGFEEAKYSLELAEGLEVDSLAYEPDYKKKRKYFWEKINFMPDRDFIVKFKESSK